MIEKSPHLPVSGHWLPNLMKANVEVKGNLIQQFFEKHRDPRKMLLTWF